MLLHKIEVKGFSSFREHNIADIPMGITGIIGSMEDAAGNSIDADAGDELLAPRVRPEQRKPK